MPRRIRVLVLASPVFFLLSCSDDPAAPEVPVQLDNELEALLATPPASNSADRAGDRAGTLDHLTRFALQKLAEARDREVVQQITDRLRGLAEAAAKAREAGDEAAFRRAIEQLETAKAQIVIRILGRQVPQRVLHHAVTRLRQIQERVTAAANTDRDLSRARRILSAASDLVQKGRQALGAGDPVAGLRLGARALDVLSRFD